MPLLGIRPADHLKRADVAEDLTTDELWAKVLLLEAFIDSYKPVPIRGLSEYEMVVFNALSRGRVATLQTFHTAMEVAGLPETTDSAIKVRLSHMRKHLREVSADVFIKNHYGQGWSVEGIKEK